MTRAAVGIMMRGETTGCAFYLSQAFYSMTLTVNQYFTFRIMAFVLPTADKINKLYIYIYIICYNIHMSSHEITSM